MHIRKLLDNGRKRVNQLHKVISNRNINLSARRHLLTLGAHAHSEGYCSCRVCMCACMCDHS